MQKSNSAIYSKEHAQWQRIVEKFGKTVTDANIDKLVNASEIPEDYLKYMKYLCSVSDDGTLFAPAADTSWLQPET